jgi:hypothetical protein
VKCAGVSATVFAEEGVRGGGSEGFRGGVRQVGEWGFERAVSCHGDVVEKGGRELFGKVFCDFLK